MTEKDEFRPSNEAVKAIIHSAILPTLRDAEASIGEKIPAMLTIQKREMLGPSFMIGGTEGALAKPKGEIRLRVRKTIDPARSVFFAEAILNDVAASSGFSGFTINGELRENNGTYTASSKSTMFRGFKESAGGIGHRMLRT